MLFKYTGIKESPNPALIPVALPGLMSPSGRQASYRLFGPVADRPHTLVSQNGSAECDPQRTVAVAENGHSTFDIRDERELSGASSRCKGSTLPSLPWSFTNFYIARFQIKKRDIANCTGLWIKLDLRCAGKRGTFDYPSFVFMIVVTVVIPFVPL